MRVALILSCALLMACPATEPRPFGLEKKTVTLIAGEAEMVGFRIAWKSTEPRPGSVVKPDGLIADINSFVEEDDAFAGGVTIHASLRTPPGAYTVTIGDQIITVTVAELPAVLNEAKTTRRSTVGLTDRQAAVATMATLNEDGTVWELLGDGGVGRMELLSGVTAVTQYGAGFEVVTLDGPSVDVRATQSEKEELHGDGTVLIEGVVKADVAAIRPYFIGATVQNTFRVFLLKDGRVDGLDTQTISRAVDVIPLGNTFLRADGAVFETMGAVGVFEPVFASKGLREFEGSAFETFANQLPEFRHHSLWRTADGISWGLASNRDGARAPLALVPPAGVEVKDVFARGRGWYLLSTEGRLYDATDGIVRATPLPFLNVRAAAAAPDVGVFSDGIPFLFGESMTVPLRVRRADFEGALTLTPRGLPPDVTVSAVAIAAGATTTSLTITFGSAGVVRPLELELALGGEGLARTTLLSVELPRGPRRMTVARDLAVKRDGTVWRFTPAPPVQLPGLANIISITDNMALDAAGVVYSFGDNSEGQLGRVTVGPSDPTPAIIPGIPPMVAIARCTAANNLSMTLDRNGQVWRFGRAGTFGGFGSSTPQLMTGLPRMVDVNGDGSPAALDETGAAWLLNRSVKLGGTAAARLGLVLDGMPAATDQNYSIPATGRLNFQVKALWYNGFATLTDRTVARLALGQGLLLAGRIPNSEGAVYASQEGVVVKADGTLWKLNTVSMVLEQVAGIDSVAAPR